jgi:hypothetical protein
MTRVTASPEALYSKPRRCAKSRRCDGHLAERHWINAGDLMVVSALPPDGEIGNTRWWHHSYCMECAPEVAS